MPKKQNDELELDFSEGDEREFTGSDADPIDAATGESLFDELSPRFTRQLDVAAAKAKDKTPKNKDLDEDELDEEEDLDQDDRRASADEAEDEIDEYLDRDGKLASTDLDEEDEDADEPTPGKGGNVKFERRLARADRLLEESRRQIAELQARDHERETKDKLAASESEFNTFKTTTEAEIAELRTKKVKAIEDGDSTAQADIDDQLIELRSELRAREREHERAKKDLAEAAKRRPVSTITVTKVTQWKRKNPRYERDEEFRAVVNGIDAELVKKGSNPELDDHYKEIDRRLRKLFPEHGKPTKPRRHPSQQVEREGSRSERRPAGDAKVSVKGGKIRISAAKLARVKENMTRFGLDPSNKKDLFDYINSNPGL